LINTKLSGVYSGLRTVYLRYRTLQSKACIRALNVI